MASEAPSIRIGTDELRTVREAVRDFSSLLAALDDGEVQKLVLTQRNRMRAVVVSVKRWSEVEDALAELKRRLAEIERRERGLAGGHE